MVGSAQRARNAPVNQGGTALFRANEGYVDRMFRVIAGLVLIAIVFVGPQTPWGWLGVIFVLTGLIGFCPLYRLVGINTCRAR